MKKRIDAFQNAICKMAAICPNMLIDPCYNGGYLGVGGGAFQKYKP